MRDDEHVSRDRYEKTFNGLEVPLCAIDPYEDQNDALQDVMALLGTLNDTVSAAELQGGRESRYGSAIDDRNTSKETNPGVAR